MILSGFSDEAGKDLAVQIAATKALGWHYIESRDVWNTSLGAMSDAEFDTFSQMLAEAEIKISCYGSRIANWSRHPRSDADFEASRQELLTALPRMKKLGIPIVRGMSFLTPKDEQPDSPELEAIIFKKVRLLAELCADFGILYGHENCMNYGGLSHLHTLKLIENVNLPNFVLIFDTGNPCFNLRHIGEPPYPIQSSWEFYQNVREFIKYVHIKDGHSQINPNTNAIENSVFTYPGFGCADLRAIITDLRLHGYDGTFSIEPHVATVFHDDTASEQNANLRFESYVRYGRETEALLKSCGY